MLARRREVTVNAALSVGWRREDRAHVGMVCEDRGGLLELSFSSLRVPEIFKVMGVQKGKGSERWSSVESPVGLKICELKRMAGAVVFDVWKRLLGKVEGEGGLKFSANRHVPKFAILSR